MTTGAGSGVSESSWVGWTHSDGVLSPLSTASNLTVTSERYDPLVPLTPSVTVAATSGGRVSAGTGSTQLSASDGSPGEPAGNRYLTLTTPSCEAARLAGVSTSTS